MQLHVACHPKRLDADVLPPPSLHIGAPPTTVTLLGARRRGDLMRFRVRAHICLSLMVYKSNQRYALPPEAAIEPRSHSHPLYVCCQLSRSAKRGDTSAPMRCMWQATCSCMHSLPFRGHSEPPRLFGGKHAGRHLLSRSRTRRAAQKACRFARASGRS